MSAFLRLTANLTFLYDYFAMHVCIYKEGQCLMSRESFWFINRFRNEFSDFGRTRRGHHSEFKYVLKILVLLIRPLWCCVEKFSISVCDSISCAFLFRDLSERSCHSLVGCPTLDSSEDSSGSCRHFSTFVCQNITCFNWKCNAFVQPWFDLLEKDIHCTLTPTPSPL